LAALGGCLPAYDPAEVSYEGNNNGNNADNNTNNADNNTNNADNNAVNNAVNNVVDPGCVPSQEVCDGLDNDCNGRVDEDFPRRGVPCGNGLGICRGVTICEGGAESCFEVQGPQEEVCDGLDNDCDGAADELTQDSVEHCGACGRACEFENGAAGCVQGECVLTGCAQGYEDCDRDLSNGCETNTTADPTNCGGCGNICGFEFAETSCQAGQCQIDACEGGRTDCNGVAVDGCEADLSVDQFHCGDCGTRCEAPHAVEACVDRACAFERCEDGFLDRNANPADGCELGLAVLGSPPDAQLGNLAIAQGGLFGVAGERLYKYQRLPDGGIGPLAFEVSLNTNVTQLAAAGDILYAALDDGDVRILDASDPQDVETVGLVVTSGPAPGFALRAPYLYLADGRDGLRVVDVSAPAEPRPVGQAPAPEVVTQVALSGDRALLSTPGRAEVFLYDVSSPNQPRWVNRFSLQQGFDRAVLEGDLLITASTGSNNVLFYRLNDAQLTYLGQTSVEGSVLALEQRFPFLIVVARGGDARVRLNLVDVRRPQRPTLANTYASTVVNDPRSAAFVEDTIYVSGSSGLQRFGISDLRRPQSLQDLVRPQALTDMVVKGNRLYVVADGAVEVYDNATPDNPQRLARLGQGVQKIHVSETALVTMGAEYPVALYNLTGLTDGAAPLYTIPSVGVPLDLESSVSGRYLYALYGSDLYTLDPQATPEEGYIKATANLGDTCHRLTRHQSALYVACNSGLYVVQPEAPEILTVQGNVGGGAIYDVLLFGQTVYGLNDSAISTFTASMPGVVSYSTTVEQGAGGLRNLTGIGSWMIASAHDRLLLINRSTLDSPQTLVTRTLGAPVQALGADVDKFYAGSSQGVYRLTVEAP
jgi:hypothetical protein